MPLANKLEHEFLVILQVQVVQTDEYLIKAFLGQHLVETLLGRDGLQQQQHLRAAPYIVTEPARIVEGRPHREHHDVGTATDNLVDLFLTTGIKGIGTHQQLRGCQRALDVADVFQRVVRLHGIEMSLSLFFSTNFKVDKYPVDTTFFSDMSDCGLIRYVH